MFYLKLNNNRPNLKFSFALIITFAVFISACSKSAHQNPFAKDDEILVDLPLGNLNDLEKKETNPKKIALIEKIKSKQLIKTDELLSIILDEQLASPPSFETDDVLTAGDLTKKFQSAVEESYSTDPSVLKVVLEQQQVESSRNEISYNSNATSMVNFFRDNKLQCFSGTLLNVFTYKKSLKGKVDLARVPVIIYEEGHVLPGYIVSLKGRFRLYGIETTSSGRAVVDYGFTNEVNKKVPGARRVILMNDFLVIEALKRNLSLSEMQFSRLIVETTKKLKQYGLNSEALEKEIVDTISRTEKTTDAQSSSGKIALNTSVLGFGTSKENGKDKKRAGFYLKVPDRSSVTLSTSGPYQPPVVHVLKVSPDIKVIEKQPPVEHVLKVSPDIKVIEKQPDYKALEKRHVEELSESMKSEKSIILGEIPATGIQKNFDSGWSIFMRPYPALQPKGIGLWVKRLNGKFEEKPSWLLSEGSLKENHPTGYIIVSVGGSSWLYRKIFTEKNDVTPEFFKNGELGALLVRFPRKRFSDGESYSGEKIFINGRILSVEPWF